MKALTPTTQPTQLTMSSREIATLTNKRHDNVKQDISHMLTKLKRDILRFQDIYFDNNNRKQIEYRLDRLNTDILLSGYSIELREIIIKRWYELEETNRIKVPQTLPEALRLAAEKEEERLRLETVILEAKPKLETYDAIMNLNKTYNLQDTAKIIGFSKQRDFFTALKSKYLLMNNAPSQLSIRQGLMTEIVHRFGRQARITAKGLEFFTKRSHTVLRHKMTKEKQQELISNELTPLL